MYSEQELKHAEEFREGIHSEALSRVRAVFPGADRGGAESQGRRNGRRRPAHLVAEHVSMEYARLPVLRADDSYGAVFQYPQQDRNQT